MGWREDEQAATAKAVEVTSALVEQMQSMTETERAAVIYELTSRYCRNCGSDSGSGCHCMNDE